MNIVVGTLSPGAHPGSYNGQDAHTGMLIPFDTTQITSASNYSTPRAGDPCHPLSATAHAPAIAQSNRGRETGATFETLRAGSHGALPMVAALGCAAIYDRGDGCDNLIVGGERVCYALTAHHGRNSGEDEFIPVIAFTERTRTEGRTLEVQEDLAYALTNSGSGGRTHSRQIAGGFGVRRLTPIECERLQGFPDDYTAWGIDEQGRRVEMSDSVRYRMLGNAICRKVSAWIDSQIVSQS